MKKEVVPHLKEQLDVIVVFLDKASWFKWFVQVKKKPSLVGYFCHPKLLMWKLETRACYFYLHIDDEYYASIMTIG